MTGCASFNVTIDKDATNEQIDDQIIASFRQAWAALRSTCPAIASWIQLDKGSEDWQKLYQPLGDDSDREQWLSSIFHIVKLPSGGDWFNSDPPTHRLPSLFLIQHGIADNRRGWHGSVALRSPHDTIDGIGVLQLLDRLLELATNNIQTRGSVEPVVLDDTEEIGRLLPLPMRVATRIDPVAGRGLEERWGAIQYQNQASAQAEARLRLPLTADGQSAGSFQRASTRGCKAVTSKLTQRCNDLGLTVTHALSAAIVIALHDLHGLSMRKGNNESSMMRYTNNAMVNLRHLMQGSVFDRLAHNVGNYHMIAAQSTAVDVTPKETMTGTVHERFVSVASQFREYYLSVRADLIWRGDQGAGLGCKGPP